jgi:hypothetical protein
LHTHTLHAKLLSIYSGTRTRKLISFLHSHNPSSVLTFSRTMCTELHFVTLTMCTELHCVTLTMCTELHCVTLTMCTEMHCVTLTMCTELHCVTLTHNVH